MADEKSELKISSDDEIKVKDSKDNEDNVDKQPETMTDNSDHKATQPLSKRQQKKLLKRQKYLEERKERKVLEKAKRREKIAKRKAEEPDLPTYSESRKRINNSYVRKEKSPVNIGKYLSSFGKVCTIKEIQCHFLDPFTWKLTEIAFFSTVSMGI